MASENPPQSVKCSSLNNDWNFIKFLNWAGVLLGAATPYDFQAQKFESLQIYKYYGCAIIVFTIFGYVHAIAGRCWNVYPHMNLSTITLDIITLTALTIFNVVVTGCSAFDVKQIDTFFGSLVKNDLFLHSKQTKKDGEQQELKLRIYATLLHIAFAGTVIYDSYIWITSFNAASLSYYFFKNFQCYIPIFVTFRFCEILKFLRIRFCFSTKILINLVNEVHKLPKEDDESISDELKQNKWIRVSQKIKPRQEDIMQLKLLSKIFNTLFEAVELFNAIFEWQLLLLHLTAVVEIFQAINYCIAYGSGSLTDAKAANQSFVFLHLMWSVIFLVLAVSTVLQGVHFSRQMRKLTRNLSKRLLQMPSEELLRDEAEEELVLLIQQFMHRPLNVKAVIFVLNYKYFVNVFLTITSFCPVLIQFNRI